MTRRPESRIASPAGAGDVGAGADSHRSQVGSSTLAKTLLWVGIALLVWQGAQLLLMAFAGALLALLLDAIANRVCHWTGMARGWGITIAVVVFFAAVGAATWFLMGEIVRQVDQLMDRLPDYLERLEASLRSSTFGERLLNSQGIGEGSGSQGAGDTDVVKSVMKHATAVGLAILNFVGNALLVAGVGIFFAIAPTLYRDGLLRIFRPALRPRVSAILDACDYNLRWWLVGKLLVMLILGAVTTAGLLAIGMPFALMLGVAAMMLSFIPYFGPLISFIPAAAIALGEPDGMFGWVCGLYLLIQLIESYVVEPLVQQQVVHLPPALVILFQVFAAVVLGFAGLMFAVPLLVVIVIVVKILLVSGTLHEEVDVPGLEPGRLPV